MNLLKITKEEVLASLKISTLALLVGTGLILVSAQGGEIYPPDNEDSWVAPSGLPTGYNVHPVLNTSSLSQTKEAGIFSDAQFVSAWLCGEGFGPNPNVTCIEEWPNINCPAGEVITKISLDQVAGSSYLYEFNHQCSGVEEPTTPTYNQCNFFWAMCLETECPDPDNCPENECSSTGVDGFVADCTAPDQGTMCQSGMCQAVYCETEDCPNQCGSHNDCDFVEPDDPDDPDDPDEDDPETPTNGEAPPIAPPQPWFGPGCPVAVGEMSNHFTVFPEDLDEDDPDFETEGLCDACDGQLEDHCPEGFDCGSGVTCADCEECDFSSGVCERDVSKAAPILEF